MGEAGQPRPVILHRVHRAAMLPWLTGFVQVLPRIFLERGLAAGGAEVIRHAFVIGLPRGCLFVYFHSANGVDRHVRSSPFLFHCSIPLVCRTVYRCGLAVRIAAWMAFSISGDGACPGEWTRSSSVKPLCPWAIIVAGRAS